MSNGKKLENDATEKEFKKAKNDLNNFKKSLHRPKKLGQFLMKYVTKT